MSEETITTKQVFILGGHLAGRTIKLGNYHFVDGQHTVIGNVKDVALIARFMERNWNALPAGDRRLEYADLASNTLGEVLKELNHGQRDIQTGEGAPLLDALQGGLQPNGEGTGQEGAGDGSGAADPEGGGAGSVPNGNGHEPELNGRLQRAVLALDPDEADHWTADGKPAMRAVETLYGAADITRADVTAVAPGHNRKAAAAAKSTQQE